MAQLLVGNIVEELVEELKIKAAWNGRSAEAGHQEILHRSCVSELPSPSFEDILREMPDMGADEDFERSSDLGRVIPLEDPADPSSSTASCA